jgi:pimeloyl-ACP methyl ester carboxylesterase
MQTGNARVLLVPGLWMHAAALLYWQRKLLQAGFAPEFFSYRFLLQTPEQSVVRLRAAALAQTNTHILAHSLGGLLAVKAMADIPEFHGKIICVGSPLRGSVVARAMAQKHLGGMAGRSLALLCQGFERIPDDLQVSVIAGIGSMGLGRLLHQFTEPNDGTVTLSETRIPGLLEHTQVNASHSAQLYSRDVMDSVLKMLPPITAPIP